ncbi:MAG: LacI family DNA-binding transcriptional regulator [Bacteroidota bacterium]|nr:LacI family DNA-binding transcriptional regulator [Bacteroidota bacterium]
MQITENIPVYPNLLFTFTRPTGRLIYSIIMKSPVITIKELAKLLDLSPTTVSRVLSGNAKKYRISDATEKLVKKTAKQYQYEPNQIARNLRLKETNTIGLVIPDISNLFFANLARIIEIELRKRGKLILLSDTHDNSDLEIETLMFLFGKKVDGMLIAPVGLKSEHLQRFTHVPMVMIDRYFTKLSVPYVSTDNFAGAYVATEYLINKNHSQIACIQGLVNAISNKERVRGFQKAIDDYGISSENIKIWGTDFSIENGYNTAKKLLVQASPPTAIFTLGNQIAIGAMRAIKENGLKIPKDISIISFDDQAYFDLTSPPLTTIRQPIDLIGQEAVRILFDLIDGKKTESKLLPAKLIERSSVELCK